MGKKHKSLFLNSFLLFRVYFVRSDPLYVRSYRIIRRICMMRMIENNALLPIFSLTSQKGDVSYCRFSKRVLTSTDEKTGDD